MPYVFKLLVQLSLIMLLSFSLKTNCILAFNSKAIHNKIVFSRLGLIKSSTGGFLNKLGLGKLHRVHSTTPDVKTSSIFHKGISSMPGDKITSDDKSLEKQPYTNKVKEIMSKYGAVAVGTYLSVYIITLSSIFTSLEYDIFNAATFGLDPIAMIKKVCDLIENTTGNKSLPAYIRSNPTVGTFAIAWVMTKFTEPLRLGITIVIVPKIAQLLGKKDTQ